MKYCFNIEILVQHFPPFFKCLATNYLQEIIMVVWFAAEYVCRIWSAGCRSRYQHMSGRIEFMRRPLCLVGGFNYECMKCLI